MSAPDVSSLGQCEMHGAVGTTANSTQNLQEGFPEEVITELNIEG